MPPTLRFLFLQSHSWVTEWKHLFCIIQALFSGVSIQCVSSFRAITPEQYWGLGIITAFVTAAGHLWSRKLHQTLLLSTSPRPTTWKTTDPSLIFTHPPFFSSVVSHGAIPAVFFPQSWKASHLSPRAQCFWIFPTPCGFRVPYATFSFLFRFFFFTFSTFLSLFASHLLPHLYWLSE